MLRHFIDQPGNFLIRNSLMKYMIIFDVQLVNGTILFKTGLPTISHKIMAHLNSCILFDISVRVRQLSR